MDRKKVLLVCKAFYPQITPRAHRATELVKELCRQGHQVTLLMPEEGYSELGDFKVKYPIEIKTYGPLTWRTLRPSSIKFIGDWKRKFGRLLFLLFEYPNIQILWKLIPCLKKEKGYDLLISIAVPHEIHWSIAFVRNKKNPIAKTWVADCGDPFMGNRLERIKPPFYFSFFEKLFCKKADYIAVPTESSIEAYYPSCRDKIKVIPQGFNFDDVDLYDYEKSPSIDLSTFGYAGGLARKGIRSLAKILDYLLDKEVDFRLHIYSRNGKDVLSDYHDKAPDKIILHDTVPRSLLLYELSKMDFLINLDNGTERNTPSKLIDYSLTERPILNISGIEPDFRLLEQFIGGNYENQLIVKNVDQYNIEKVVNSFLSLIDQNSVFKDASSDRL